MKWNSWTGLSGSIRLCREKHPRYVCPESVSSKMELTINIIFMNCEAGWRQDRFTSTDRGPGDWWKVRRPTGEQERARCDGDPPPPEGSTSTRLRQPLSIEVQGEPTFHSGQHARPRLPRGVAMLGGLGGGLGNRTPQVPAPMRFIFSWRRQNELLSPFFIFP